MDEMEKNNRSATDALTQILGIILFLFGIFAIYIAFQWYYRGLGNHSTDDLIGLSANTYGDIEDAYEIMIAAALSTAEIVKGIFWMILGCASLILGRLVSIKLQPRK